MPASSFFCGGIALTSGRIAPIGTESDVLLTESRRISNGWRVGLSGSIGTQSVSGSQSTVASYEASLSGYLHGCVNARAAFGYSNSALETTSRYQRHYGGLSLRL